MKTFKDLTFKTHDAVSFEKRAVLHFPNGYGVSVITGAGAYASPNKPYEVAVIRETEDTYEGSPVTELIYNLPICHNDVIGYQDEAGVTRVMRAVQETPPRECDLLSQ